MYPPPAIHPPPRALQQIFSQHLSPRAPCWHYEYGSATALFVLPRESRTPLIAAANGDAGDLGATCDTTATDGDGDSVPLRGRSLRAVEGTGGALRVEEMPADENGVRDLLQASFVLPVYSAVRGGGGVYRSLCAGRKNRQREICKALQ